MSEKRFLRRVASVVSKKRETDAASVENLSDASAIAPTVADSLEQGQYAKFYTRNGHGFAAEDANALADRLRGRKVETVGRSNVLNGADRIVDGVAIQTKYCRTPAATIRAAFDSKTGLFRYDGQLLEVPKDQRDACVELMKLKIAEGKVPGVSNPNDAEKIVKAGEITYRQARNVARAGTVDSLVYDAKNGVVSSSCVFGISFVVVCAARIWRGEDPREAAAQASKGAFAAAVSALTTSVATAQFLRTRAAASVGVAIRGATKSLAKTGAGKFVVEKVAATSCGKAVYGAAAVGRVSKLARTNAAASAATTLFLSAPDAYRAAIRKSVSWRQFSKNFGVNAASTVGGAGGWFAGAALGAAVAGPVGGVVGGLAGAVGGGALAQRGAKAVADSLAPDDRTILLNELETAFSVAASDYLLSETELETATARAQELATPEWTRERWQEAAPERAERIASDADAICSAIASDRALLTATL